MHQKYISSKSTRLEMAVQLELLDIGEKIGRWF